MQTFTAAVAGRGLRRLRSLLPTRNAVVVTAFLAVAFEFTYLAAFFIRGELLIAPAAARQIVETVWWVVGLKIVVFYTHGFCHRPLHAASFEDLNLLLRVSTLAMLVVAAANLYAGTFPFWTDIPRSVLLLDWAVTVLFLGGAQAVLRSIFDEVTYPRPVGGQRPVLLIDASSEGRKLAAKVRDGAEVPYLVAGLLDDDPSHYGARVGSARVLGPVAVAAACAERLRVSKILVREGALYGRRLRSLCESCAEKSIRVQIATLVGASRGNASRVTVRDVELRDLLSRPRSQLSAFDADVRGLLKGRTVLVTGAGGSIGSEICRQLVRFAPKKLVLVERSEVALFSIVRQLTKRDHVDDQLLRPALLDIANAFRTEQLFAEERPDVVLHAAAYKHLPLMESHPAEAIENNALATAALAEIARRHEVKTFVALSTDKAVNPSSVMGASKLLGERYLQAMAADTGMRCVVVRFGNVLASSGSAVPIFEEQLRAGRRITITHPDVRRYFMTIDEAAQLVLVAASSSDGGGTYVLEMGEPILIVDIVHSIAYVMEVPQRELVFEYCGLRPGEKLEEELFFSDERREQTASPLVIAATRPPRQLEAIQRWCERLEHAIRTTGEDAGALLMRFAQEDCDASHPLERMNKSGFALRKEVSR